MQIKRVIKAGCKGTKKLVEEYGDRLICIRYRYDPISHLQIKTVEIVVGKKLCHNTPHKIPINKIMKIRIEYGELRLSRLVKTAGGRWNRGKKVWELRYSEVRALGLDNRIVDG